MMECEIEIILELKEWKTEMKLGLKLNWNDPFVNKIGHFDYYKNWKAYWIKNLFTVNGLFTVQLLPLAYKNVSSQMFGSKLWSKSRMYQ